MRTVCWANFETADRLKPNIHLLKLFCPAIEATNYPAVTLDNPATTAKMSSHSTAAAAIAAARDRARALDREDQLAFTRSEFNIPTKAQIASTRLTDSGVTIRVLGDS